MKSKIGIGLAAIAVTAGTQIAVGANSASAAPYYLLKNAATGKCAQYSLTTMPSAIKMVTCSSSSGSQKWFPGSNVIMAGNTGPAQYCLGVTSTANTSFASTTVLIPCSGASGYKKLTYSGVGYGKIILNGCYMGHYASSDTWSSCYYNAGNYTKWNFISV
ncbi:hypothetical protein GCM10029978_065730 [Actinoallomurus acanthiterrae]